MNVFNDLFSKEEALQIEEKYYLMKVILQKIEKIKDLKSILGVDEATLEQITKGKIGSFTIEELKIFIKKLNEAK
jgi:predicted XRE-type DNA-binding protein